MNADISCWSTRWQGVEEYPHRYATLRAYNLIKSKVFTDADLHMIAERTGDVMCYLFFRQAHDGSRSGITLCVNGYACRNLDRLALLTAPVVDTLSDFVLGEGDDARTEDFIAERLDELREKLEVATDLGESSLSPLDYAIKNDNYTSYAWGYADPKAILASSEQGVIYVRFSCFVMPTHPLASITKPSADDTNTRVEVKMAKKDFYYNRLLYSLCGFLLLIVAALWRQGVTAKEMSKSIDSIEFQYDQLVRRNQELNNRYWSQHHYLMDPNDHTYDVLELEDYLKLYGTHNKTSSSYDSYDSEEEEDDYEENLWNEDEEDDSEDSFWDDEENDEDYY